MREPFHTLIWKASIGYNDSWSQVDPEVLEKFAELIIQECCALIAPSQELKKDPSFPYMGGAEGVELLDGSVRLIKEHFGVEE